VGCIIACMPRKTAGSKRRWAFIHYWHHRAGWGWAARVEMALQLRHNACCHTADDIQLNRPIHTDVRAPTPQATQNTVQEKTAVRSSTAHLPPAVAACQVSF
jgi:hypothetical protein